MIRSVKSTAGKDKLYQYFDSDEAEKLYNDLQMNSTKNDNENIIHVLDTNRPDIVLILLEGFSQKFVDKGIAPNIASLEANSLYFSKAYANSVCTERGIFSALCAYPDFPNFSVIDIPKKNRNLPSIASLLKKVGYSTAFFYGGSLNFRDINSYLSATGYDKTYGEEHFPDYAKNIQYWGIPDHIFFDTIVHHIERGNPDNRPFFISGITLSSHDPWDVPFNRYPGDKVANSFAYTDSCIGDFISKVSKTDVWNNLLIIFVADHGKADLAALSETDVTKHHIPLIFTGGAIRKDTVIDRYCSQTDIAATLLSAMGLPHDDFRFSRNVLSKTYTYPFIIHTFSTGFEFIDSTGYSIYDLESNRPLKEKPSHSETRIRRAKAYLQHAIGDFNNL